MNMPIPAQVNQLHPAPYGHKAIPDGPYVLAPIALALDLRDSPLALGIYVLVARAYFVHQTPIPLSATDIQTYDATAELSRGAITRAIDRLIASGWLIPHASLGQKSAYRPAWGRVHGTVRPWEMEEPCLACPRTVRTVRVPSSLLDVCFGRIIPHVRHKALVERYVTHPALTLHDVGVYTLALAGLGTSTAALARLGLADHAGPIPPPSSTTLLARISQQPLLNPAPNAPAINALGLRRVGIISTSPSAPAEPDDPLLFFVPPELIGELPGGMIGNLIGYDDADKEAQSASGRDIPAFLRVPKPTHGGMDAKGDSTTTTSVDITKYACGGGKNNHSPRTRGRRVPPQVGLCETAKSAPVQNKGSELPASTDDTGDVIVSTQTGETMRLLRSIGVRTDIAAQLAAHTHTQVSRVITQARARAGIRDLAAWVVSALRTLPLDDIAEDPSASDEHVSVYPIHMHPNLTADERSCWLLRFRRATTPTEQRAVIARLEKEYPL